MTAGPCRAAKPWGWNAIESAKWSSWTQLGDTPAIDAMKMYVSTMEEENPDWYDLVTDGGDPERVAEVLEMAADAVAAAGTRAGADAERRARAEAAAAAAAPRRLARTLRSTASSRRTASGRTFPPKSRVSSLAGDTRTPSPPSATRSSSSAATRPVVGWPTRTCSTFRR